MDSYKLSPLSIANWFIRNVDRDAGDSITHLKLQKLMYYSQAWSMVVFDKSLFEEDFEAWAHGPVLRSIYVEFKSFSWNAINDTLENDSLDGEIPKEIEELLSEIKRVYGEKSAKYLEDLTHSEKPWKETRNGMPIEARSSKKIPKSLMKDYYYKIYNNGKKEQEQE